MNVSSETFNLMNTSCHDNAAFVHSYKFARSVVMPCLRNRFVRSTATLRRVLFVFGLDSASNSKRAKIWSGLCYLLVFQANLYVLLDRSYSHIHGFLNNVDHLIPLLDRSIRFLGISIVHMSLVLKLRRNLNLFFNLLEPVDYRLHRPVLSKIRPASIAGVIWILAMVKCEIFFFYKFIILVLLIKSSLSSATAKQFAPCTGNFFPDEQNPSFFGSK